MADVIWAHGPGLVAARGPQMTPAQICVLTRLSACRTPVLGGHRYVCTKCGKEHRAHNSCRNRHCTSCLAHRSRQWLDDRSQDLLPVPYFHLVFTQPPETAELSLGNKKVMYGILFRAAAQALAELALDPRHLGAKIGFLGILHTWSQKLTHHPHVHFVVPAGGLRPKKSTWVHARKGFFLPVRPLSRLFRGKFLAFLEQAWREGKLSFAGSTAGLAERRNFEAFIARMRKKEWVVYAKRPFGSPEQVLKYLARYTHRVAISNRRILSIERDRVVFRYRKSAKDNRWGTLNLDGQEFLRRFLLHVLPKGFVRIRHFGFLANTHRAQMLARCRAALGVPASPPPNLEDTCDDEDEIGLDGLASSPRRCPHCGFVAPMRRVGVLRPLDVLGRARALIPRELAWDTS